VPNHQHHHQTTVMEPEVRYMPAPRRPARPSMLGSVVAGLFEMILRFMLTVGVIVALVVAVFLGGLMLVGWAVDQLPQPDTPTDTTSP
jgi:hypothetical protein